VAAVTLDGSSALVKQSNPPAAAVGCHHKTPRIGHHQQVAWWRLL